MYDRNGNTLLSPPLPATPFPRINLPRSGQPLHLFSLLVPVSSFAWINTHFGRPHPHPHTYILATAYSPSLLQQGKLCRPACAGPANCSPAQPPGIIFTTIPYSTDSLLPRHPVHHQSSTPFDLEHTPDTCMNLARRVGSFSPVVSYPLHTFRFCFFLCSSSSILPWPRISPRRLCGLAVCSREPVSIPGERHCVTSRP